MGNPIEEGRAASKSPHYKFGYFISMSQQAISAGIIQNSAVGNFSKTEETNDKSSADKLVTTQIWELKNLLSLFLLMCFPFQYILNSLQSNYSIIAQLIHENSIQTFSNHNTSFTIL